MVIDQRLYEKISGRTGDPYERAALANAQMAGRKGSRNDPRDRSALSNITIGAVKFRWWMSIIASLVVLALLLLSFVRF